MAGLEFARSGVLFLANGQQQNYAFDFGKDPTGYNWIRPAVYFNAFTDQSSQLQYVAEYAFWDGADPIPPFWGLTLRATGNCQFVFTLARVSP